MHTASSQYSASGPHYVGYSGASQRHGSWEYPAVADPRQPRKKTKVETYSRRSPGPERPHYDHAIKQEADVVSPTYSEWDYEDPVPRSGYYGEELPQAEDCYGRRTSGGSPNYSYGSSSRGGGGSGYRSHSGDVAHGQYGAPHAESGDTRGAARRTYGGIPGGQWDAETAASGHGNESTQQVLQDLFPELTSPNADHQQPYPSPTGETYGLYSRPAPAGDGYYQAYPRYPSSSSTRHASQRPRRDYPNLAGYSERSPTAPHYYDGMYGDDSDFGIGDDADDSDGDSDVSAIVMRSAASPRAYYESSESPSALSIDTPGPDTPHTMKYSSPDILTSSNANSTPKRATGSLRPSKYSTTAPHTSANAAAIASITLENYDDNDIRLVQMRQRGVSYKTIKNELGLDEAESTLRGRYRTLTKPKNERLRKPIWSEDDIALLLEAVNPDLPHIKWKQVSDTIVEGGGSYRFGSSTCKKQYLALVACGRAKPLCESAGASKRSKHHYSLPPPPPPPPPPPHHHHARRK